MYVLGLYYVLLIWDYMFYDPLFLEYQFISIRYNKKISLKRITFARNLKIRNGFKMWYSWFA